MGIALMALAMIPFCIAEIALCVGIVLAIIGKMKNKKAMFVGGMITLIIGGIVIIFYIILLFWLVTF